jgi:hypothetical protein
MHFYIGSENLYPQIYIPNYEAHKLKRRNASMRTTDVTQNEFVVYDGNEEVTSVRSYTYNEEGQGIPTGTIVKENYALDNEIFVVSINETVQNDGEVPLVTNSTEGTSQTLSLTNMKIDWIYVKDHKKSWLAGDSEVHMKAIASTWNHRRDGNPAYELKDYSTLRYAPSDNYNGHEIKKVSRGDISSGVGAQYYINYPIQTDWVVDRFNVDPIAYTYVIFEYDTWPAKVRTAASQVVSSPDEAGRNTFLNFRSSDGPYGGLPGNEYVNYAIYGNVSGLQVNYPGQTHYNSFAVLSNWNT